jgi:hypothetical protein
LLNEFSGKRWQLIVPAVRPAGLDRNILALDKAFGLEALTKRPDLVFLGRCAAKSANGWHRSTLAARGER